MNSGEYCSPNVLSRVMKTDQWDDLPGSLLINIVP